VELPHPVTRGLTHRPHHRDPHSTDLFFYAPLGASTGLLTFLHCKEETPAKCKLSSAQEEEIDVKFSGKTESATKGILQGASGASELFIVLKIENKPGETCPTTGEFAVSGSQLIETPEGRTERTEHEIVAKNTGSMLTFGGNTAKFKTTAKLMLGSGKSWFITEAGV
jgi:hypothetical protein